MNCQWRSEGTLRPGGKKDCAPTKIAEFAVKIRLKNAEEAVAEYILCVLLLLLLLYIFEAIKYV